MCGECSAHLRPPPWRPRVPAPRPLRAWAQEPGPGDWRRREMGASICPGPRQRGFHGLGLLPLAPAAEWVSQGGVKGRVRNPVLERTEGRELVLS